jgi:hypothetical protein
MGAEGDRPGVAINGGVIDLEQHENPERLKGLAGALSTPVAPFVLRSTGMGASPAQFLLQL